MDRGEEKANGGQSAVSRLVYKALTGLAELAIVGIGIAFLMLPVCVLVFSFDHVIFAVIGKGLQSLIGAVSFIATVCWCIALGIFARIKVAWICAVIAALFISGFAIWQTQFVYASDIPFLKAVATTFSVVLTLLFCVRRYYFRSSSGWWL